MRVKAAALALCAIIAPAFALATAAAGQPPAPGGIAASMPPISLPAQTLSITVHGQAVQVAVGGADPDADATQAALDDIGANGLMAASHHLAQLRQVMADMPEPFEAASERGDQEIVRTASLEDCAAFATAYLGAGGAKRVACQGNPYPTAGFYLGSYFNEIGQPDQALAALDQALAAAPNVPLVLAERNAALIALQRWDDVLAGADRGLAQRQLSARDHALMLRNRGYALTELKRLDEAQQAYEQSLTFEPGNTLAQNELTYIAGLKAGAAPEQGAIFLPNKPQAPDKPKSN
jgi:tetratricopeptide (TPR) repeat protein